MNTIRKKNCFFQNLKMKDWSNLMDLMEQFVSWKSSKLLKGYFRVIFQKIDRKMKILKSWCTFLNFLQKNSLYKSFTKSCLSWKFGKKGVFLLFRISKYFYPLHFVSNFRINFQQKLEFDQICVQIFSFTLDNTKYLIK